MLVKEVQYSMVRALELSVFAPCLRSSDPAGSNTEDQVPALKAQPNTKHTVKTLLRIG